ncbi:MAG TPA: pyridoxamine 5'-phosphate oxidase family protein, partial [bacterium]
MSQAAPPGWPHAHSPFHAGERAMQERVGVGSKMEAAGRRAIRDYMPEQHREFFSLLPFLLVGTVDPHGQPWASVVAGPSGFITSPDPHHLRVHAQPQPGDPLAETLLDGAAIGLL